MSNRSAVLDLLKRAAHSGLPCPSNRDIANAIGCTSSGTSASIVSQLEKDGAISVERGNVSRVVTITSTGRRTAGAVTSPHWRLSNDNKAVAAAEATKRTRLQKSSARPVVAAPIIPEIISRDPCTYCGTRGDIGCKHNRRAA